MRVGASHRYVIINNTEMNLCIKQEGLKDSSAFVVPHAPAFTPQKKGDATSSQVRGGVRIRLGGVETLSLLAAFAGGAYHGVALAICKKESPYTDQADRRVRASSLSVRGDDIAIESNE